MSDDNPPPLPPRGLRPMPSHGDPAGLQQDVQMWQQFGGLSQPQPTPGVQALPVGIGFSGRPGPQQPMWPDHSSAFSQRGWQPFSQAHAQQSPQESQELNPQIVRSQQQNWPSEMNHIQLQQLQHLILLQQQQQQQQQHHLQQMQQPHHHQPDQGLHHLDPVGHDDHSHEKFTKSPSPQIEESRNSPAVGRQFIQHNITSPQQQLWQHPQMVPQYDIQQEAQHSQPQPFPHTPVSHHQPLFAQQPYVQQPLWQHHTPYSQVQVQHLRQSTPPIQQHVLWHQQQQQQLQQHQLQQQQHHHQQQQQQHPAQPHHPEPPHPFSPPSSTSSVPENHKPVGFDMKDMDIRKDNIFTNTRVQQHGESLVSRAEKLGGMETMVTTMNTGSTPATQAFGLMANSSPKPPIRILSKSSQPHVEPVQSTAVGFGVQATANRSQEPPNADSVNHWQRPVQGAGSMNNQSAMSVPQKTHNFNPNPGMNPYQNLNNQNNYNMKVPSLFGGQPHTPRFLSPVKDRSPAGAAPAMNQYRPRSPAAVVRNHTPQGVVINNVYQKNPQALHQASNFHRMENQVLYLFVQGLNPHTRSESIQNYFEAVGRPTTVKDHILFNLEHTEALIVFTQKPDLVRLRANVKKQTLDGCSLDICEVPPPRAVVISSDVHIRSTETVKLYFERDVVGGALKNNSLDETEDGCLLLEFKDPQVVSKLCSNPRATHRVDGVTLRVSPYYQCENGTIWDMNVHIVPLPQPVNIQIPPDRLEFVKRHSQPNFMSCLREKQADVTLFRDHVTVKCMLRQTMPNYRKLVRGWATGVQEAVAKFLSAVDQSTVNIPDNIWDDLTNFLNSGRQELKDVFIKPERERHTLKLVGIKGNVKTAQKVIEDKANSLSRSARRKSETRKVKSAEHLAILDYQDTLPDICKKFEDLLIHVEGNEVTVEGDPSDIPNAFIEIYAECEKIEPKHFKHNKSREWVQFVKKENSNSYVQKRLDKKRIKGCWSVNNTEMLVYVPIGGNPETIRDIVIKCIVEEIIDVDKASTDLLNSEVWNDFLKDLRRRASDMAEMTTKNGQQEVTVIGFDETVPGLVRQVRDFLDQKTVKSVTIQCDDLQLQFIKQCWVEEDYKELKDLNVTITRKTNGLELSGLSDDLIKGKQKLDLKLKRLCSKKHQFKRTGVQSVLKMCFQNGTVASIEKECKCVIQLPRELLLDTTMMLNEYEFAEAEYCEQVEDGSYHNSNSSPKCFQTKHHKIKISLVKGEIGNQKADVLVASASSQLNLKSGSASYSLVRVGGASLQADCTKLYPQGIEEGQVAVIPGGHLACEKVYLTALPAWKEAGSDNGKVLRDFMRECLRLADRHSKKSVAFSAMGTGNYLGYPRELVASIMYGAVVEFDNSYGRTTLNKVSIVLYEKDTETIKAFEEHEHMRVHGSSSLGPLSSDFAGGKIKMELVTADLSMQKVDALLCSVSTDMNLKRSNICSALIKNGGSALENDCSKKYNCELEVGKVAEISSGNLPCKTVYLTVLPQYVESNTAEQALVSILQQVFTKLSSRGFKSVAMPAMGTGYLGYPKMTAARCMYEAVLEWVRKNPKSSLKTVRFVMYSKDLESQQAYRACHLKCQGREMRLGRNFLGDGTVLVTGDGGCKYKMIKDGCIIGNVKLTVTVGDLLTSKVDAVVNGVTANFDMHGAIAKALIAKCPNILPECQQKKSDLKKDGVVLTSSAGLAAKHVIHVQFQDSLTNWKAKLLTCLGEAHKHNLTSVAFPVLGTGSGPRTFLPGSIAECLFVAVDDFSSKNAGSTVTEVHLVVHSSNKDWVGPIMSALQAKTTVSNSNPLALKFMGGGSIRLVADLAAAMASASAQTKSSPDSVQVVVYSDAIINIERCIRAMDDKIGLAYIQRTVKADGEIIAALTSKEIDNMVSPDILVNVKFDNKNNVFTVSGPFQNVNAALDCIHNKLRQYQREKKSKEQARLLYMSIKWHWICDDHTSGPTEKPYSEMINFMIEEAYNAGKDSVELEDTEGKQYVINFKKLQESSKLTPGDSVKVVRKNILKAGGQVQLPSQWQAMGTNENFKRVPLGSGQEYSDIEKKFVNQVKTGPYHQKIANRNSVKVLAIERVQNKMLYCQYDAKRKQLKSQKLPKPFERQIWHGTHENCIMGILNNGFNRSYCGAHGTWFGEGVYFAADASYSVQDYLTKGATGKRYIILASVLTGEYVKGIQGMRVPPNKPNNSTDLYESTVNDEQNPMEFVIYNDTQANPEYLITFTL